MTQTTETPTRRLSRAPKAGTKMGAIFAALVRHAMQDGRGPTTGVAVHTLATECGLESGYASAQLCVLRRRGLVSSVGLGQWLPTADGVDAARAIYGPNLDGLVR